VRIHLSFCADSISLEELVSDEVLDDDVAVLHLVLFKLAKAGAGLQTFSSL